MSFTTVRVTQRYPLGYGAAQGTVTFRLTQTISDGLGDSVPPASITCTLDAGGNLIGPDSLTGVLLQANDDSTTTPPGTAWVVQENLTGIYTPSYAVIVSHTMAPTIALSQVPRGAPIAAPYFVTGPAGPAGVPPWGTPSAYSSAVTYEPFIASTNPLVPSTPASAVATAAGTWVCLRQVLNVTPGTDPTAWILVAPTGPTGLPGGVVLASRPLLAYNYGVSPSNGDNTTDLNVAFTAAAGTTLELPPGVLAHSGALTAVDCNIVGAGEVATTLQCSGSLGAGVAALTLTSNTGWYPTVRGFSMVGPGARSLGVKTANCDGFKLTGASAGSGFIEKLAISQFDSGIDINNTSGHVFMRGLVLTNNYYGLYVTAAGGDFDVSDCVLAGNTWSSIGCVAGIGLAGWSFKRVHLGFGPYGIYEEPGAQGVGALFLYEADMEQVRFEQIGNGAIWSDADDTTSNYSISGPFRIIDPGFSWAGGTPGGSSVYSLPSKPASYAIKLGHTLYSVDINDDATPFTAGSASPSVAAAASAAGIFYVGTAGHTSWSRRDMLGLAASSDMTVGPGGGQPNYYFGDHDIRATAVGTAVLPPVTYVTDLVFGPSGSASAVLLAGAGVPVAALPAGSLYIRTDTPTIADQRLYMSTGSAWTPLSV